MSATGQNRNKATRKSGRAGPEIIDIRRSRIEASLKDGILAGLGKKEGRKYLPMLLLYDERGLRIFEEITRLGDYYPAAAEIEVLERYAEEIAERIEDGSILVELGSGNLQKASIILRALDRLGKRLTYYALDLALPELVRTLAAVPEGTFKNIRCVGLHGTYEDGRAWLRDSPGVKDKARCILWFGSSVGNFSLTEVKEFLRDFAGDTLKAGGNDCMIVGSDANKDKSKIEKAYADSKGLTRKFILNGLNQANLVLGGDYFVQGDWEYISEWDAKEGRHQAYYGALKDVSFDHPDLRGLPVRKGERIHIEYSYKYDEAESRELWAQAGLMEGARWSNVTGDYYIRMLYKPPFIFEKRLPAVYAAQPVPSLKEWKELWKAWDLVTLGMLPKDKLLSKPIGLRNPCIFYLGHIPTFLDYHISRATSTELTPPGQRYQDIFQRGIDPDVDNPELCHAHSAIPDQWPALKEILRFTADTRSKVAAMYDHAGWLKDITPDLPRAIWMAFEHETLHLETYLYILLQSNDSLPPPGISRPDFAGLRATEEARERLEEADSWLEVPNTVIDVGIDDPEEPVNTPLCYFGWDNEKPHRQGIGVSRFSIRAYPITNGEYFKYLYATSAVGVPATWEISAPLAGNGTSRNGDAGILRNGPQIQLSAFMGFISVKTVFGPVPLHLALDWPAMASYDELSGCAMWMGGRIPSANECRAAYQHVEKQESVEKLARRFDGVNSHLVNNGAIESPPPSCSEDLEKQRDSLFQDLRDLNIGFENWHPTSVRSKDAARLKGRCNMGGAWEWTSTVLQEHEGFKPGRLYPEYTADFFDGKHNMVLGGGWATHPRVAGRKSFINWYQRKYRYAWCTARIVRDQ